MIPGIFKNISKKLIYLDKLIFPLEIIDIIKSFAFYKVNTLPYYKFVSKKKEPILNKLKKLKYIPGVYNGFWNIIRFEKNTQYITLQAKNCVFCGEYIIAGWTTYHLTPSSLPICLCV